MKILMKSVLFLKYVIGLFSLMQSFLTYAYSSSQLASPKLCSQVFDEGQLHEPCAELKFHNTLSVNELKQVCQSCQQHQCQYEMFAKWNSREVLYAFNDETSKSSTRTIVEKNNSTFMKTHLEAEAFDWFEYLIPHTYVIHVDSEHMNRQIQMRHRLETINISNQKISFVDKFDPLSFTEKELFCLKDYGYTFVNHFSMNTKHYAAYVDMLKKGHLYALIIEDDVSFQSGSKLGRKKREWVSFDVTSSYYKANSTIKSIGFRDTINSIIGPSLPIATLKIPGSFQDRKRSEGEGEGEGEGVWDLTSYEFDILQLGGCDHHWRKYQQNFKSAREFYTSKVINAHLSVNSCSRCTLAYIVSRQGVVKLLSRLGDSPSSPMRVHLDKVWREKKRKPHHNQTEQQQQQQQWPYSSRNDSTTSKSSSSSLIANSQLNCLWVEPPIIWANPGKTKDGFVSTISPSGGDSHQPQSITPINTENNLSSNSKRLDMNKTTSSITTSAYSMNNTKKTRISQVTNIHHTSRPPPPPSSESQQIIFRKESYFFIFVFTNCFVLVIYVYRVR